MIWEQLGFSKCPYFWEELTVSDEGFELFVGRAVESRRFIVNASESEGCTVIVGGPIGIGKTSFVNHNQYILYRGIDEHPDLAFTKPHLLPSLRKIQVRDGDAIDAIYLKILSGLIFTIQSICKADARAFPKRLEDIRQYVSQIVSASTGKGAGVSLFGFGANYSGGSGRSVVDPGQSREMTFLELLEQTNEVAREEFGVDGITVPINNLDIVSPDYLVPTLNYLRDSLFSMKLFWWVLLGGTGLHQFVRHNVPRLAGVVTGPAIELGPLSPQELEQIVAQRLETFALSSPTPRSPVPMSILKYLYRESAGDIRFTFQVANDIVKRVFYDYPSITEINEEHAAGQIALITREEFLSGSLNEIDRKIALVVIGQPEFKSISPEHFQMFGLSSAKECGTALEDLVYKRFLTRDASAAGHVTYSPRGFLSLAQTLRVSKFLAGFGS